MIAFGAIASFASAQWTVTPVNLGARVYGTSGTSHVGEGALWIGATAAPIYLTPTNWEYANTVDVIGSHQVGVVWGRGLPLHAAFWAGSAASFVDLHPSGGPMSSGANGIASGAPGEPDSIVGWVTGPLASLWKGPNPESWVNLAPGGWQSEAMAANGDFQAGYAYTLVDATARKHAGIWAGTAASWVDVHPAGFLESSILDMSSVNQVGWAYSAEGQHAGIWTGTAASWVDLHPTGARASYAQGTSGPVQVGAVAVGRYFHAALWTGSGNAWMDLHKMLPLGFPESYATAVYCDGVNFTAVGYAIRSQNVMQWPQAFVWSGPVPNDSYTLTLNKSSVAGENYVMGTITMAQIRPTVTTFITYDDSSLVTTPASVGVLPGELVKSFQIKTVAINSTINTTIYAKRGTVIHSQTLTLKPLVPTAVVFNPNPVTGGQDAICRIVINGVAGPAGRTISILDNSPFASGPSTVTVAPAGTDVFFTIATLPVTAVKTVTVTARVSAGEKTGTFRINP